MADVRGELASANGDLAQLKQMSNEEAAAANQDLARLKEIIESLNSKLDETRRAVAEIRTRADQQEQRLQTFKGVIDKLKRQIDAGQLDVKIARGDTP